MEGGGEEVKSIRPFLTFSRREMGERGRVMASLVQTVPGVSAAVFLSHPYSLLNSHTDTHAHTHTHTHTHRRTSNPG